MRPSRGGGGSRSPGRKARPAARSRPRDDGRIASPAVRSTASIHPGFDSYLHRLSYKLSRSDRSHDRNSSAMPLHIRAPGPTMSPNLIMTIRSRPWVRDITGSSLRNGDRGAEARIRSRRPCSSTWSRRAAAGRSLQSRGRGRRLRLRHGGRCQTRRPTPASCRTASRRRTRNVMATSQRSWPGSAGDWSTWSSRRALPDGVQARLRGVQTRRTNPSSRTTALPARTCVGTTGLAYDALVEID